MSDPSERTFTADFRRFFLRGLVVLLPTVLTLWIVVAAYRFVDANIAKPINHGIQFSLVHATPMWSPLKSVFEPSEERVRSKISEEQALGTTLTEREVRIKARAEIIRKWWDDRWYTRGIGLIVAIVAVYIAGRLLGGFFGRRIYRKLEDLITSLPVFKQVYPYVKQIVDFLFSDERPIEFNRVVAAEYPRRGIWSVGFMTGATLRSIETKAGKSVTVFIPSSPTPFTGYTITVPREDIIELPISVEEAIRFAVSGGVLVPEHQRTTMAPSEPDPGSGGLDSGDTLPSGLIPIPGPHSGTGSAPGFAPGTGSGDGSADGTGAGSGDGEPGGTRGDLTAASPPRTDTAPKSDPGHEGRSRNVG